MTVGGFWRGVALTGFVTLLAAIAPLSAQAQGDDVDSLNRQVEQFYRAGQYAKATELAKQTVELWEKNFGPEHPDLATALNNLAELYRVQSLYAEAEPLFERSLAIREKTLGPEHPYITQSLNNLAALYRDQGRYAEAEPMLKRSLAINEKSLGPEHPYIAQSLNNLAALYRDQGRYAEAEPLFERSLAINEKALGPEHPDIAITLSNLASLYSAQGRYPEAEPILKRSLAIKEKSLGPEHPDLAVTLGNLAELYHAQGRYAEAEPLYKRALAINEKTLAAEHPYIAQSLSNLAALYRDQGRYAEAEPLLERSLAINEKALGSEHSDVAVSLSNLAELYREQGHYSDAEQLYKRALAIWEMGLGPDHARVATALNNLAVFYFAQGRYGETEPLLKRALAIWEKAFGPEHPDVAANLNNLAELYHAQGRYAEAEPLLKRSIAIKEKSLGPEHPDVAIALNNLAQLYDGQGRYGETEPLYKRALAIWEKALGPEHAVVGTSINNLALLYNAQGRYAEAEPLHKRALAVREKALGPEHPDVAQSLNNLAELYRAQGRYAEAEPLFTRALAIRQTALGPDHPDVASGLNNLAALALAQHDWAQAADYWRGSTKVIQRRVERGLGGSEGGSVKGEAMQYRWDFLGLIKMTDLVSPLGHADRARQAQEMFETAQWALASDAASSLAQMAARSAKGDTALAKLVRERQDLVGEWQFKDKQLIADKSQLPAKRNPDAEKLLSDRLTAIDARREAIDAQFAKDFPEYASLASPKPASVAEVQALLGPNEALVLFLDTADNLAPVVPEETFIWVITKGDVRWVKSELGTKALGERVAALRCGLDRTAWSDANSWPEVTDQQKREKASQIALRQRCLELIKREPGEEIIEVGTQNEKIVVLPFDLARAHELYKRLLGAVEDMIEGKRLLIVPSGPLTSIPFNVLVTEPPMAGIPERLAQYRDVAWLGARTAITVLPSVASLKALRQFAKPSRATKPYLGIGNPLLDGVQDDLFLGDYYKKLAALARTKRCSQTPIPEQIALAAGPRSARDFASIFRGAQADIEDVRSQEPLPETADELCEIARRLGVPESDILLGADATEARLKDLSDQGRLADYAVVHFATHGTLTGQVQGLAEPGLILTPPPKGTSDPNALERDDGYLTASEITTLKVDADWVVLSACNTAGPQDEGAEALSGLARAFFYAGARALLVSHWAVGTDAAVKLTTRLFAELKAHPEIGRAEAMRISMKELVEEGDLAEAHPRQWAPFVVVGEGAAR